MQKNVEHLIANLKCKELAPRVEAILELGRLRVMSAVPALVEALSDPETRSLACWALGRIGAKAAVKNILMLLADEDPLVRHEAVLALARIGDKRAAKPIAKLLQLDPDAKVREECAEALVAFPSDETIAALKAAAENDPSKLVRERANKSLIIVKLRKLGVE